MRAVELMEAATAQLDRASLAIDRSQEAMAEAEDFDRRFPAGSWLPPLGGVPLLVGSALVEKGCYSAANALSSAERVLSHPIINALVRDGALVVGCTSVSANLSVHPIAPRDHIDAASPMDEDPLALALWRGAVAVGVSVEDLDSIATRVRLGIASYRPTLGFAPSVDYPKMATIMVVAHTLVEQAYLLDRLRAIGVRGDPRFVPHANPKSLATFAASPSRPPRIGLWSLAPTTAHDGGATVVGAGTTCIETLEACGVPLDTVALSASALSYFRRCMRTGPALGGSAAISLTSGDSGAWCKSVAEVDQLFDTAEVVIVATPTDAVGEHSDAQTVWSLTQLANLPMAVLPDAGVTLVGPRFGDASLLRAAAWLGEVVASQ